MAKKIVFVLNAITITRCQKRVQEFIDHGYEVEVYGFERGGETYAKPASYEIETIGYHPVSMSYYKRLLVIMNALRRLHKKYKYQKDVVFYYFFFDVAFVPMLLNHKRILWDLHELPLLFTSNFLLRKLLRYTFNRCKVVLHANPQRADFLESLGVVSDRSKHIAIRNYPNFDDVDIVHDETFKAFIEWKGARKCVYLQGLSEERRSAYESVAAVLKQGDLVAVVVGKMYPEGLERLKHDFGEEVLRDRILFVGKIAQLKIPQYVSECQLSLIFYKNVQLNNWYCEANRFYQSVILGLPVVTGNNPSMKELVEKYGFGVSLDDDGSSIEKIVIGMNQVLSNYDYYCKNTLRYRSNLLWDNQEDVIKHVVDKLMT